MDALILFPQNILLLYLPEVWISFDNITTFTSVLPGTRKHIYLASFPISFDKVLNYNHPTQNTYLFPSHTYNQPFSRWPISAPLLTSWLNYSLVGKSGPITFKLFLTSSPLLYLPALLWECYILPPVFPFPPSTISLLVHVLKCPPS